MYDVLKVFAGRVNGFSLHDLIWTTLFKIVNVALGSEVPSPVLMASAGLSLMALSGKLDPRPVFNGTMRDILVRQP